VIEGFGNLEDGRLVESIRLAAGELELEVLTYGAILRRLVFPVRGARRNAFLHFATLAEYERDRAYVGPVVGRFGNRIANSRFTLAGREHVVTANEGANHLHGGAIGFGKRVWRIVAATEDRATLAYRSPAGEEGYPGTLDATISYELSVDAVKITLGAVTDAPTPLNLTYHPYFNLNADEPATDMRLRIPASHYLPVRAGLIPTGERAPVAGTPFDFRAARRLAPPELATHAQLGPGGGYDHCWVLDAAADCACELTSASGDATLTMLGTGPGLQFYNGQFLSRAHPSLGSGVILEPQGLPNAPNEAGFPDSIVRPGETWRAVIEYRLRTD
jgi:aldose 1-epimerase